MIVVVPLVIDAQRAAGSLRAARVQRAQRERDHRQCLSHEFCRGAYFAVEGHDIQYNRSARGLQPPVPKST